MAENINIKVLIDAAQSAKTIQETKKALRDLRTAALQVEEGSQAFQDITTAAGQLQDRIGDLAATTKYLGDDLKNLKGFTSIAQGIAGGFAIAQGAAQLFGVENGKVEESIMKLQTAMSLLQGVQAVGEVLQKESAATLFIQNGLRKAAVALAGEQAIAEAAVAVSTGTATVAQRALNAAMNANPILALVGLLATAATALFMFSKDTKEATKAEEEAKKASEERTKALEAEKDAYESFIGKEAAGYQTLAAQLAATNPKSQERLDLIKQINDTYGTTLKNLSDENEFQKQVTESISEYITFLKQKYALQSQQKAIETALGKQATLEKEILDLEIQRGVVQTQLNAKKLGVYRDINIEQTPEWKQVQATQKLIDEKKNQIKAEEGVVNSAIQNSVKLSQQIKTSGLRTSTERVENEKKTNEKVLKEHKDFVADYKSLDETIVKNTEDIQTQIIDGWTNTYEKQSLELKASMESQKQTIIDEYNSALDNVNENFKSWAESSNITLKGLDTSQIQSYYDKFVASQVGLNQKLEILETQKTVKLDQINRSYLTQQEALFKEQSDKIKELILESTNVVLATSEYQRYINYVELKTKQLKETVVQANKDTYDRVAKEYLRALKDFNDYQELTKDIAKKAGTEAYLSSKGFYELRTQDLQNLSAEQTLLYEQNITDSKEFIERFSKWNTELMKIGSSTRDLMNEQSRLNRENTLYIKTIEAIKEAGGILDFSEDLTKAFIKEGEAITGADITLLNYLDTLQKVGMTTPEDTKRILNFGEAISVVKDSVDVVGTAWMSVSKTSKDNIGQIIYNVLDLGRTISKNEIGQNKLLSAVYLDKLNILKGAEKDISAEIVASNQRNIDNNQKFIDGQKSLITAYKETLKDKSLTPIDAERYKNELAKAEEELKKFEENQKKFVEKQSTQKSFAVKPTGPDQIGLEQLIKDYPELNNKIVTLLEERYNAMTKVENEFYEESKNNLFMSLQKGEITQEQYDKRTEILEISHQENLLSIDVSYGKKGQDALQENEKKKGAIIKSEQDKVKASKEEFVQELIALEQTLQSGIMDMINAEYELRIDNINREYDVRIGNIAAEARAYELSLQDRTAAEIQVAQKKQAFEDEQDQLKLERDNKINQLRKEQFNKQKAADIIQAGINGALAITRALAETGPFALAIQGLVAASVAAQIGFIAAQQPAFADGGLVTGPGGPKDDKISARLSNGESVINAKSTKMYAPILSAINQAGGGKAIPFAKGGLVTNTPPPMTIGEKAMVVDTSRLEQAINRLNERPVETYVKESRITAAQSQSQKEKRRTSF